MCVMVECKGGMDFLGFDAPSPHACAFLACLQARNEIKTPYYSSISLASQDWEMSESAFAAGASVSHYPWRKEEVAEEL